MRVSGFFANALNQRFLAGDNAALGPAQQFVTTERNQVYAIGEIIGDFFGLPGRPRAVKSTRQPLPRSTMQGKNRAHAPFSEGFSSTD